MWMVSCSFGYYSCKCNIIDYHLYFQEQNFYAEVNGDLMPVAKAADGGKYQVSVVFIYLYLLLAVQNMQTLLSKGCTL